MVCEFIDVFLKNYQERSAKRNWLWDWINPLCSTYSNAPYRIAPTELRKLKIQLDELL